MTTIYHATNTRDSMFYELNSRIFGPLDVLSALAAGRYVRAAEVDTSDLDGAYAMTNSRDCHWSENPGVASTGRSMRSTSVGDVLISDSGECFVVAPAGFDSLGITRWALRVGEVVS